MANESESTGIFGNPFIWDFAFPIWLYLHAQVRSTATLIVVLVTILVLSSSHILLDGKLRLLKAQGVKTTNDAMQKLLTRWFIPLAILTFSTIAIYVYGVYRIQEYYSETTGYYLFWIGLGGFIYNGLNVFLNRKQLSFDYNKLGETIWRKK